MLIIGRLLLLILTSISLGEFSKRIIRHLDSYTRHAGISHFAATAIIISLTTSFPELIVAVSSSFKNASALAFGNALGANMINISLVIGLTAIVGKSLFFNHSTRPDKILLPLLFSFLPLIFALNGTITRLEGLILLGFYFFYIRSLILSIRENPVISAPVQSSPKFISPHSVKHLLMIIFWGSLLVVAAQIVISISHSMAGDLGLSLSFIGIFIISIGTTLPELFFNIKAVRHQHGSMATANVVGSCITNANLILGLSALINPITFTRSYDMILPIIEYFFVTVLFFFFVTTKKRLDTWEAYVLVVFFLFYALLEVLF
ncbi:MAG: hypothetical protein WC686_00270 [Candidatus Shapirobacteria bacterium]|jgi:cation:H+ antiporter